jgi:transcriptional regulator with XRE-family HTH domain
MEKKVTAAQGECGVSFEELNRRALEEDSELRWEFEAERVRIDAAMRLKRLREEQGLTQEEMARRSGTTQPMLSRFFACEDDRSPTIETLVKLADAVKKRLDIQFVDVVTFEWNRPVGPSEFDAHWAPQGANVVELTPAARAVRASQRFVVAPRADAVGVLNDLRRA